jgi:hypothetical protein
VISMSLEFGYNLTATSYLIIELLFKFRGVTATQLAALIYGKHYTLSQEKNIYNFLSKLKKQKLVSNIRLQGSYSKGSIYYLAEKGYEFAKELLNIQEGQRGNGWINAGMPLFADIPYTTYKPPLVQTTHHLLLIDFFIELREIKETEIAYRLNLYASQNYESEEKQYRFRPDGEIEFLDGRLFTIEVDVGSETHEQFRQKFRVYRRYFEYIETQKGESLPNGIIVVVQNKRKDHGIKRRWANIVSAFYKEIGDYHFRVNLMMTTLDSVKKTLIFEDNRFQYEIKASKYIQEMLANQGFKAINYSYNTGSSIQENAFLYSINHDDYRIYFNAVCQAYETKIYSRYCKMFSYVSGGPYQKDVVKGLKYTGYGKNIFHSGDKPFLIQNMKADDTCFEQEFLDAFNDLAKSASFHVLEDNAFQ